MKGLNSLRVSACSRNRAMKRPLCCFVFVAAEVLSLSRRMKILFKDQENKVDQSWDSGSSLEKELGQRRTRVTNSLDHSWNMTSNEQTETFCHILKLSEGHSEHGGLSIIIWTIPEHCIKSQYIVTKSNTFGIWIGKNLQILKKQQKKGSKSGKSWRENWDWTRKTVWRCQKMDQSGKKRAKSD